MFSIQPGQTILISASLSQKWNDTYLQHNIPSNNYSRTSHFDYCSKHTLLVLSLACVVFSKSNTTLKSRLTINRQTTILKRTCWSTSNTNDWLRRSNGNLASLPITGERNCGRSGAIFEVVIAIQVDVEGWRFVRVSEFHLGNSRRIVCSML